MFSVVFYLVQLLIRIVNYLCIVAGFARFNRIFLGGKHK